MVIRSELDYTVCTDPLCVIRTCTPCSLRPPITSCCRKTVRCPTTNEMHVCATQRGK